MGDKTAIEWTDASWTPIRARNKATGAVGWHCEHITPGCEHCYSEGINKRLGTGLPFKPGHRRDIEIFLDEKMLLAPLRWRRSRMIFVCSMTDLFADFVTDEIRDRVFAVMALAPRHTFQVLTKRSARMRAYMDHPVQCTSWTIPRSGVIEAAAQILAQDVGERHPPEFRWPLPNVWLGVSAEDQARADERVPNLLATSAAVRFVSAEPLLAPIGLHRIREGTVFHFNSLSTKVGISFRGVGLDWIIVGGESGPGARPMHPQWARSIRDQCAAAGVAYFLKQWGEWLPAIEADDGARGYMVPDDGGEEDRFGGVRSAPVSRAFPDQTMWRVGKKAAGRLLDGRTHDAMPEVRT